MSMVGELEKVSCYKWKIKYFHTVLSRISRKAGEYLYSPTFKVSHKKQDYTIRIQLYPYGDTDEDEAGFSKYLTLKIAHDARYDNPVDIDILQISIRNKNNEIISQQRLDKVPLIKYKNINFYKFIERKYLLDPRSENHVLVDGSLLIQMDIIFDPDVLQSAVICHTTEPVKDFVKDKSKCACDDFEQLLDCEMFSDVKVVIRDKTIYLHKNILTSRSQVFEAMFQHQMKESKNGVINVTDVKYEVMKELLRFIYASKVNNIETIAWDLLFAANKYCMDDLKTMCEKSLSSSLNRDNAVDYLVSANSCNAEQLKCQIIQFINDNPDVVDQPEFKTLDSDIMYEVVRAVTRKRVKH